MQKELYLVWQGGEDEQFYNQYFSLRDAVTSESEGALVYKVSLQLLGTFTVHTKLVKTSTKKSSVKKTAKKASKGKK